MELVLLAEDEDLLDQQQRAIRFSCPALPYGGVA